MVASSHVWVHTLHWAMLFNYLHWSPRWKYIAHISEAKCLGQMHWEIKYTSCHLIWQSSFPSYWIEVVSCTALVAWQCTVHVDVCSKCRCVSKSHCLCWDLALNNDTMVLNHTRHSSNIICPRKKETEQHITSSPVWENHKDYVFA